MHIQNQYVQRLLHIKKTICATGNSQYQQSIQIGIKLLRNRAITKQNNKKTELSN